MEGRIFCTSFPEAPALFELGGVVEVHSDAGGGGMKAQGKISPLAPLLFVQKERQEGQWGLPRKARSFRQCLKRQPMWVSTQHPAQPGGSSDLGGVFRASSMEK